MEFDAVVLAGRYNTGKLSACDSAALEANIDIAGKPMVKYVLDALCAVKRIKRVYLVGPRDGLLPYETSQVRVVEPGSDLLENVRKGLDASSTDYVLVSTSDIPLVTPPVIDQFLDRCMQFPADFYYPASFKQDCERLFPSVQRTYVTLREGTFTGGNLFLVRKGAMQNAWPIVRKMIEYRKSPLKMASVLGLKLLIKVATKTARVEELEQKVASLLGIKAKAILGASPEISVDVDKPSDLELCRRILSR